MVCNNSTVRNYQTQVQQYWCTMSQVSKNMTIYQQNTMSLSLKKPNLKHYSSCFGVRTTTHNALIIIAQQELSIHVTKIVTHLKRGPKNQTYIDEYRSWKIRCILNIECLHLTAMIMDESNLKYYSSCYSDRKKTTVHHSKELNKSYPSMWQQ